MDLLLNKTVIVGHQSAADARAHLGGLVLHVDQTNLNEKNYCESWYLGLHIEPLLFKKLGTMSPCFAADSGVHFGGLVLYIDNTIFNEKRLR